MSTTYLTKRLPRRVDLEYDRMDRKCVTLAAAGMSTRYIVNKTGLSPSQITYRIMRAGLTKANGASRMDFRNGSSPFSAAALSAMESVIDRKIVRFIHAHW